MRASCISLALFLAACDSTSLSLETEPLLGSGLLEEGASSVADAAMFRIDARGMDLCAPAGASRTGLTVAEGRLWIADRCNRRTLGFALPAETGDLADIVLHQPDFFTSAHVGMPASERVTPVAVASDGSGRLYVGTEEHSVLVYTDPSENGQSASATLQGVPEDIAAIRRLVLEPDAREVIAVVGAADIAFYPAGNVAPVSFWQLEHNPCPGALADVATVSIVPGDDALGDTLLVACADTSHRCPAEAQISPPPTYIPPSNACSAVYALRIDTTVDANVFRYPRVDPLYGSAIIPAYSLAHPIGALAASGPLDALVIDDGGNRLLQLTGVHDHLDALFNQPPGAAAFPAEAAGESDAAFAFGQGNTQDRFPNRDDTFAGDAAAADSLLHPGGLAVASDGALWVADAGNHRVLRYGDLAGNDDVASVVLGQATFSARVANRLDAYSSQALSGLAWRPDGTLYVADALSHRVLLMTDADSLPSHAMAGAVIGQDSFHAALPNGYGAPGLGAGDLQAPSAVAVDPETGAVFVSDQGNGRILIYPSGETSPTGVIGAPDRDTAGNSCFVFLSMAARFGTLYVAAASRDNGSCDDIPLAHRVFAYTLPHTPSASALPDRVFGQHQAPSLEATPNLPNRGGVGVFADTLHDVGGLYVDAEHRLWVADRGNHRVLWFDEADGPDSFEAVIADGVVGQDDLSSSAPYGVDGAPSGTSFRAPDDIVVDAAGGLWVSFSEDHRVLYFATPMQTGPGSPLASHVLGQGSSVSTEPNRGLDDADLASLHTPRALALDAAGRTLAVADTGNRRVVLYHQNRPPEVGGELSHTVEAGALLEVSLELSDPDGDELAVPVLTGVFPAELSSAATIDSGTFRFAAPSDAGETAVEVHFEVSDTAPVPRTASAIMALTIVPPEPPPSVEDGGVEDGGVEDGGVEDGGVEEDGGVGGDGGIGREGGVGSEGTPPDSCGGCTMTGSSGSLLGLCLLGLWLLRLVPSRTRRAPDRLPAGSGQVRRDGGAHGVAPVSSRTEIVTRLDS